MSATATEKMEAATKRQAEVTAKAKPKKAATEAEKRERKRKPTEHEDGMNGVDDNRVEGRERSPQRVSGTSKRNNGGNITTGGIDALLD